MTLMLDADGFLPPGPHRASVAEVEQVFATTTATAQRREVLDNWLRHRSWVSDACTIREQWLDGSFVTSKDDPGDADVITIVDGLIFDALPVHRQELVRYLHRGHATRDAIGVDAFLIVRYPEGHPDYATYSATVGQWTWQWSRIRGRMDRWKGYVEVTSE